MNYIQHLAQAYHQTAGNIVNRFVNFYRDMISFTRDTEASAYATDIVTVQKVLAVKIFHGFSALYMITVFLVAAVAYSFALLALPSLAYFNWFEE